VHIKRANRNDYPFAPSFKKKIAYLQVTLYPLPDSIVANSLQSFAFSLAGNSLK
jgi:hypothetical protein